MTHDEAFEAFRSRREAERAAEVRVTWRRISKRAGADAGAGGWSGLGPDGKLVYVVPALTGFAYGVVVDGARSPRGCSSSAERAKRAAADLLSPQTKESPTS